MDLVGSLTAGAEQLGKSITTNVTNFTKEATQNLLGNPTYGGKNKYGYITSSFGNTPAQYQVLIHSSLRTHADRSETLVKALMQNNFEMRVEGDWVAMPQITDALGGLGTFIQKWGEQTAQTFGFSTKTLFNSRRMWNGSSPIEIPLTLKFEAIRDPYNEVYMACKALQKMALPGILSKTASAGIGLIPPGPSPVYGNSTSQGDKIRIMIGRFLVFNLVIIKSVNVEFSARMTEQGLPLGAKVDLMFQTYEIQTKTSLNKIYSGSNVVSSKTFF